MLSVYSFPRKHLARVMFGDDGAKSLRRIDAWLDGESRMTVDAFWALTRLEPLISIEKSLRDLYERYEIAAWRKRRRESEESDDGLGLDGGGL